jgi:hypothetical protein
LDADVAFDSCLQRIVERELQRARIAQIFVGIRAVTGSVVGTTGGGVCRTGTTFGVGVGVCAASDVAANRQTTAVNPLTAVMKPSWTRLYYAINCSEFRE